ncbi:MAG: hypothetical protein JNM25_05595 [Planctomycetes bacterium]|nr:hypothetical protein [Planctomycetota bacterium]
MRNLLSVVVAACLAGVPGAQTAVAVPTFGAGSVQQLSCRVVAATAKRGTSLLVVEVQNQGTLAAEPLEFRLEVADRKAPGGVRAETFRRVQLPRARRFGRSVPAGGRQSYVVPTQLAIGRGAKAVQVLSACWCDGGVVPAPDLALGAPRMVQRSSLAGTFNVTEVELGNPYDRDLDVLLRVTLAQPYDTVELMGLRLAAGQRRTWTLPALAGAQPYLDETAAACQLRATAFEVVDWSLVAPNDAQQVEALLRPAYAAWYRWPDAVTAVSGRFVHHVRRQRVDDVAHYDEFEAQGRYTLTRGGDAIVTFDSGDTGGVESAIAQAFEFVARPDYAMLAARNELVQVTDDRIELRGPGWGVVRSGAAGQLSTGGAASAVRHQDVQVDGDRLVGTGYDDARTEWTTQDTAHGWLVTRTRSSTVAQTFAYGDCEGQLAPIDWTSTTTFGDRLYSSERLELFDTTFGEAARIAPPRPTGDGVAALRAIWDTGYRLPDAPLELAASFVITQPGVDQLWRGQKRIAGRLVTTGIGRHLRRLQVTFDQAASPELEHDLGFLLRDRLLMWYLRDFGDRLPFDEFFGGAEIGGKGADGSFRIEHGPVEVVETQDGLVRGFRDRDGTRTRLQWQTVAGQKVVQRFEREHAASPRGGAAFTERVTVTWAAVGAHLLPTRIVLEDIFGRDFGTETIVLKNLTVKENE